MAQTGAADGHRHTFDPGDLFTSVVNGHKHSIGSGASSTGEANGHAHSLASATREAKREILDGDIFFLSLVDAGANEVEVMLKSRTDRPLHKISALAKLDKEGLLYTLVYGPHVVDTQGDFASKEGVRKLAHKFIKNMVGSGIDIMHNCKPVAVEDAYVCESFIIQKNGDDRFLGVTIAGKRIDDTTELEGWWASIIKLNAPYLRQPFENGEWSGVSMYGTAQVEPVTKSDFTTALAARLGINPNPPKETDMDEQKLAQAIAAALNPLVEKVTALTKSVETLTKPTAEPTTNPSDGAQDLPTFDGDVNDLETVEAYEEELFRSRLDFTNEKDLAKWKAHLVKKAEQDAAGGDNTEIAKAKAEAEAATRRYQELAKSSNQNTDEVKGNESDTDRIARIRKTAKETVQTVLRSQGRIK